MRHSNLTRNDAATIRAFADEDMNITGAAHAMNLDPSTVRWRLEQIYRITKLNPRKFWELVELLKRTGAMP